MSEIWLVKPEGKPKDLEEWRAGWREIGTFERHRQWIYGDWFNAGERFLDLEKDEFHTQAELSARVLKLVPHVGIEPKTLANWAALATKFPAGDRNLALEWSHHRELAHLTLKEAKQWLQKAAVEQWSVADLREALGRKDECGESASLPGFVPRRWVGECVRWFKSELEATPLEDWPKARRHALKREFQPLLDILQAL